MTREEAGAVLLCFATDGREVAPNAVAACPYCVAGRVRRLLEALPEWEDLIQSALAELAERSDVFKAAQVFLRAPNKKRPTKKVW